MVLQVTATPKPVIQSIVTAPPALPASQPQIASDPTPDPVQAAAEAEIDRAKEVSSVSETEIPIAPRAGQVKGAFSTRNLAPFALGLFLGTIIGMSGAFLSGRAQKKRKEE
ncbi:MAG: hypothetical protein HY459_00810 [Parcubacteria group bacterium]|nr:hypothetical protein [Parcubacteria group bacterium]